MAKLQVGVVFVVYGAFVLSFLLGWNVPTTTAFYPHHLPPKQKALTTRSTLSRWLKEPNDDNDDNDSSNSSSINNDSMDPLTRSSWYVVEWFGKVFGSNNNNDENDTTARLDPLQQQQQQLSPRSMSETLERIKIDNDRSYFLSGRVDEEIYDPNCVFRDPFVAFEGRERFVTNLANLGSFITKYDARVLEYTEVDALTIQTKIMVKLELNLPWKPILAWPWGVKYTIDPQTYRIVDHEESWDIEPWEGVKQIFRKPTLQL